MSMGIRRVRILSLMLVSLLLLVVACETTSPPQPDIPRYTADQVIAVAKASVSGNPETFETFDVEYLGNGIWRIDARFYKTKYGFIRKYEVGYFYESNGKMDWVWSGDKPPPS